MSRLKRGVEYKKSLGFPWKVVYQYALKCTSVPTICTSVPTMCTNVLVYHQYMYQCTNMCHPQNLADWLICLHCAFLEESVSPDLSPLCIKVKYSSIGFPWKAHPRNLTPRPIIRLQQILVVQCVVPLCHFLTQTLFSI